MIEVTGGISGLGKKRFDKSKLLIVVGIIVVITALAVAGFFFWQWFQLKNNSGDETAKRITTAVSKLYILPDTETPTVAVVQSKDKLKEQPFFDKAQDGDYILVYKDSKLALLYREKDNRLVNVGPVSINDQGQAAGAQTEKK